MTDKMIISCVSADILENREHKIEKKTFAEQGNTRKILLGTRENGTPGRASLNVYFSEPD